MKKHILNLLFMFISLPVFAVPEAPYAHLAVYNDVDKPFFEHLIKGQRATYQICTPNFEKDNEENNTLFLMGLNTWIETTETLIRERPNGKEEFGDILQIIDKIRNFKIIERIPCQYENSTINLTADLNIIFDITPEGENTGNYDLKLKYMRLNKYLPLDDSHYVTVPMLSTITHELGHVFGLADRYSGMKHTGSYIYSSLTDRPSIMKGDYSVQEITCDDIDGFITSIDRIRKNKRTFKSFCNDDIILVNGKAEIIKGGYVYNYKDFFSYQNANYDADISITYEDKSTETNTYIMDMVLGNFAESKGSFNLLKSMGFNTKNIDLRQDIKVSIHAPVQELSKGNRLPIGLTTLILEVNGKTNQVINISYDTKKASYIRTLFTPNKITETIEGSLDLPIMNYVPHPKIDQMIENGIINYMEKQDYKKQFPYKDTK